MQRLCVLKSSIMRANAIDTVHYAGHRYQPPPDLKFEQNEEFEVVAASYEDSWTTRVESFEEGPPEIPGLRSKAVYDLRTCLGEAALEMSRAVFWPMGPDGERKYREGVVEFRVIHKTVRS